MNFPTRSAALLFVAAATFTGVPQNAEAAPASKARTVSEAIAAFNQACDENITVTKALSIKLTDIAPKLMWRTCAAAEAANVTSQCIWANAHAVDVQAVKGTSNCIKQHTVAVVTDTANKAEKIGNSLLNTPTGKVVSRTAEQQEKVTVKSTVRAYNKVKSTYKSTAHAITHFFSGW